MAKSQIHVAKGHTVIHLVDDLAMAISLVITTDQGTIALEKVGLLNMISLGKTVQEKADLASMTDQEMIGPGKGDRANMIVQETIGEGMTDQEISKEIGLKVHSKAFQPETNS